MSKTTPGGGTAAVRPPGASPGAPDAEAAILAELAQDYQTHCAPCFLGMPEHCTAGLAPNGQPCVTTPAQRIAWLLDVVQQVVAQRNTAAGENAALTARLAALAAQDGHWRALVRDLATTLAIYANPEHWFATECSCSNPNCTSPDLAVIDRAGSQTAADALAKAQAALAAAPPPTH